INKADREGADRLVSVVENQLSLKSHGADEWRTPIVKTVATTGQGVPDLMDAIARYRTHSESVRGERRRARSAHRLRELVAEQLMNHLEQHVLAAGEMQSIVDRIAS